MDYKSEMDSILNMANKQQEAEYERRQGDFPNQIMTALAPLASASMKFTPTQSQIMAKQEAPDFSQITYNAFTQPASLRSQQLKDQYQSTIDQFKNQNEMQRLLNHYKQLDLQNKREENRLLRDEQRAIREDRRNIREENRYQNEINDRGEKGTLRDLQIKKYQNDINKSAKEDKYKFISKVEDVDKYFQSFERLYGSIGELEKKFQEGKLNPQDRFQLVRLLVPLSEINPGVVREAEQDMVLQQQPYLTQIKGMFDSKLTGEKINDFVVKDMFDTARSLKSVVANMKYDQLKKLQDQTRDFNIQDDDAIFGEKNKKLLVDPKNFAVFGNKKEVKNQLENMSDEQLYNLWKAKQGKQ